MAGIKEEKKIYLVGIYCRLSKDDGTDNESASIATQKSILTDYVKKQGWHIAKTYVDDGYSGTNFQRPSFQNMIKDIESGLINCVITKDLSRLGRNYLDCGLYLEVFFPEHNVRYIAVNDGVDTLNKSAMDITPFRNILNEMYAADISVKIKSAYRARFQQGKFMGTTAPYGYIKDPADHNHLLIIICTGAFGTIRFLFLSAFLSSPILKSSFPDRAGKSLEMSPPCQSDTINPRCLILSVML
jgi:site-specific DNA recombinase